MLVITNKNKAAEMLASIGVQPAEQSSILGLAKDNITQHTSESQEETSGTDLNADADGDIAQQTSYSRKMDTEMMDNAEAYNTKSGNVSAEVMDEARANRIVIKNLLAAAEYDPNGVRKLLLPEGETKRREHVRQSRKKLPVGRKARREAVFFIKIIQLVQFFTDENRLPTAPAPLVMIRKATHTMATHTVMMAAMIPFFIFSHPFCRNPC